MVKGSQHKKKVPTRIAIYFDPRRCLLNCFLLDVAFGLSKNFFMDTFSSLILAWLLREDLSVWLEFSTIDRLCSNFLTLFACFCAMAYILVQKKLMNNRGNRKFTAPTKMLYSGVVKKKQNI